MTLKRCIKTGEQVTYGEDFTNVVGERSHRVHISLTQHLHETGAVSFQQPISDGLELTALCYNDTLLGVCLWQVHVHLANRFDTLHIT